MKKIFVAIFTLMVFVAPVVAVADTCTYTLTFGDPELDYFCYHEFQIYQMSNPGDKLTDWKNTYDDPDNSSSSDSFAINLITGFTEDVNKKSCSDTTDHTTYKIRSAARAPNDTAGKLLNYNVQPFMDKSGTNLTFTLNKDLCVDTRTTDVFSVSHIPINCDASGGYGTKSVRCEKLGKRGGTSEQCTGICVKECLWPCYVKSTDKDTPGLCERNPDLTWTGYNFTGKGTGGKKYSGTASKDSCNVTKGEKHVPADPGEFKFRFTRVDNTGVTQNAYVDDSGIPLNYDNNVRGTFDADIDFGGPSATSLSIASATSLSTPSKTRFATTTTTTGAPDIKIGQECCVAGTSKCVEHEKSTIGTGGKCIFDCESGYLPKSDNTCEPKGADCKQTDSDFPQYATAAAKNTSGKCMATACHTGFERVNGKCTCGSDCTIESNGTLCNCPRLSKEDEQARLNELRKNEQDMKDREKSAANKLLGGAAIGTAGHGARMALGAQAEQSADEAAERDMRAYIATFKCDYGAGRNINGGEKGVQVPTSPELPALVSEYKQLASSLKISKEALNMTPGIESEVIFDSATTGLYDDVSSGIQKGAFASVYRAMIDPEGEDAQRWAAQKAKTAEHLKTGTTLLGVGVIGGIAGNLAINGAYSHDKSRDILEKYEGKKRRIDVTPTTPVPCPSDSTGNIPNCKCKATNYIYTINNGCTPCGTNQHADISDLRNQKCKCNDGYHPDPTSTNELKCIQDSPTAKDCTKFDKNAPLVNFDKCECVANAKPNDKQCTCNTGYRPNTLNTQCDKCTLTGKYVNADSYGCECITNAHPNENNTGCECDNGYDDNDQTCNNQQTTVSPLKLEMATDETFKLGEYKLTDQQCTDLITKIKKQLTNDENKTNYEQLLKLFDPNNTAQTATQPLCVNIVGHTDRGYFHAHKDGKLHVGNETFTNNADGQYKANKKLALLRAEKVKSCIENSTQSLLNNANAKIDANARGAGWMYCTNNDFDTKKFPKDKNCIINRVTCAHCRRIDIDISYGVCKPLTLDYSNSTPSTSEELESLKNANISAQKFYWGLRKKLGQVKEIPELSATAEDAATLNAHTKLFQNLINILDTASKNQTIITCLKTDDKVWAKGNCHDISEEIKNKFSNSTKHSDTIYSPKLQQICKIYSQDSYYYTFKNTCQPLSRDMCQGKFNEDVIINTPYYFKSYSTGTQMCALADTTDFYPTNK